MIQSWKSEGAREVFEGRIPKRFPGDLAAVTRRKLAQLHAATRVDDMRVPPGNRLEQLAGDREGQWSLRVNDQFRICFKWGENGPEEVEFVDCH